MWIHCTSQEKEILLCELLALSTQLWTHIIPFDWWKPQQSGVSRFPGCSMSVSICKSLSLTSGFSTVTLMGKVNVFVGFFFFPDYYAKSILHISGLWTGTECRFFLHFLNCSFARELFTKWDLPFSVLYHKTGQKLCISTLQ